MRGGRSLRSHWGRKQAEVWPRAQVPITLPFDRNLVWVMPWWSSCSCDALLDLTALRISLSWCISGMPLRRCREPGPESDQVYAPSCDSSLTWRLHSSHASSGSPPPLEKLTCVMTMQCPRSTSSLKVLTQVTLMPLYISSHRAFTLPCPYGSEMQRKAWRARAAQAANYSVRIPTTPFIFSLGLELFRNMECFSTYLSRVNLGKKVVHNASDSSLVNKYIKSWVLVNISQTAEKARQVGIIPEMQRIQD